MRTGCTRAEIIRSPSCGKHGVVVRKPRVHPGGKTGAGDDITRRRGYGAHAGWPTVRLAIMTWLITGGAGYIGAHVVHAMTAAGERVVVLDDFSTGADDRLPKGVPVGRGSVLDRSLLDRVLADYGVTGVVHLAARKQPGSRSSSRWVTTATMCTG